MGSYGKSTAALLLTVVVAGCTPPIPESGPQAGVGFTDYSTYEQQRLDREARLRGEAVPPAGTISGEQPAGSGERLTIMADPRAIAEPALAEGQDEAQPADQPRVIGDPNNSGISDEQDFEAVSGRESIESDAARIAGNRQRYEQVQPSALPRRSGSSAPNIVEFALSTTNPVGQSLYRRTIILAENRFNRNCAQYASPDLAQESFLAAGGPQRDRMGLDPDGDGFACYWDPTPFRSARSALSPATE